MAFTMAFTGLSTRFISRLVNTSVTPLGGVTSPVSVFSVKVSTMGKRRLATTAQAAATTLPTMYRTTMIFRLVFWPFPMWHRELMTRKNTRIGAIPRSAPTNRSPRMEMPEAWGMVSPRMMPTIRPQMIRLTRLMLFHFLITFLTVSIPLSLSFFFAFTLMIAKITLRHCFPLILQEREGFVNNNYKFF